MTRRRNSIALLSNPEALGDEEVLIALTRGQFARIDAKDLKSVAPYSWYADLDQQGKFYARRSRRIDGRKVTEGLHRFLMGCSTGDGKLVDHRDGNPLNNCRYNLRIVDPSGNMANVTSSKLQKSGGFKGVHWNKRANKWQASIGAGEKQPNGRRRLIYLGVFVSAIEAARAYDAAAIAAFGDLAATNFARDLGAA